MNRALWHTSATSSELRDVERPDGPDLRRVRSLYSMISTGTEKLIATGRAAAAGIDIGAPYVDGDFGFPIKYGYSLVGEDDDGNIVHCLHPHQSIAYVDSAVTIAVPRSIPVRRAALLSNMETVITAIWDARIRDRSPIVICGFGNIGALLANTLRLRNDVLPIIVETDEWRRNKARSLGFEAFDPEQAPIQAPVIFNTSCNIAGLQFCIDNTAMDGAVVELSWYGKQAVSLNLGAAFHRRRIRLISSQVSAIPAHMRESETIASRKLRALDLLADTSFDDLITNEIAFEDAPLFFRALRDNRQGDGLIWLIKYTA